MSRLRPILANLALTAVATVLAFFVAEACMRYAGKRPVNPTLPRG